MSIRNEEYFGQYNDRVTGWLHKVRRTEGNRFARLDEMLEGNIPFQLGFVIRVGFEDWRRDLINQMKLTQRAYCIAFKKQMDGQRNDHRS